MSPRPGTPLDRDLSDLVLETRRLVLRRPTRADAESLAALADDAGIAEHLSTLPHPYTLDDALVFIDNTEIGPHRLNLGIYRRGDDGAFLGTIGLMPRDGERFVLGYWLGRPHWGDGLATEAAQGLVDFAFETLGAEAVAATARVTNGASRRVLEKCGFQYAGQGMGPSLYHRGLVPIDRFRLERSIWTSLKNWSRSAVA
ncbi:N-acetyltransferase [Siculibacillus lacustris]|uniref:N-acetyltransferase n=1 Tax=Siculibacillus lacustris TaxID=1549641 RepID=A0A4Q9VVV4_9HYPH|nr:GNAT family N-acetyltransferase [Siculibacillus lacustris]TBW39980.1 N-acetyltransferase [Siculibacillus lacustris]